MAAAQSASEPMNLSLPAPSSRVDSSSVKSVSPKSDRIEMKKSIPSDLVGRLLGGAVGVGVVLGEAAHAGQAVDDAGLLVEIGRAHV